MQGYLEIEERLAAAKATFSAAFRNIANARIVKTQRNRFALRFKYPLLIALCLAVIAAVFVVQFVFGQFDALYIVCECVIVVALAAFVVLLCISWHGNLRNAKCAEIIEYYNGGIKCVTSEIAGGGKKVEWKEARFYFLGEDKAELFEGGEKVYRPFVYKKMRGHSRNFALLDADALTANFFDGAEVLSEEDGVTSLSSGLRFCVSDGVLKWFEIEGMYSECYENNFPVYAPLSVSRSYVFRYELTDVNREPYRMILPEIVREACNFYFTPPPIDENIRIQDLKK